MSKKDGNHTIITVLIDIVSLAISSNLMLSILEIISTRDSIISDYINLRLYSVIVYLSIFFYTLYKISTISKRL